jgi:hypothetical protein
MTTLRGSIVSVVGVAFLATTLSSCAQSRLTGVASGCTLLPVTVSSGTAPTFSWDAACRVEEIIVGTPGPGGITWSVFSVDQTNSIASPVAYGSTPPGAAMTGNVVLPLVAGNSYIVTLIRVDTPGGPPQGAGSATFVP